MGVLEYVVNNLEYGCVEEKGRGLFMICTRGWSDDEDLLHDLISLPSMFRIHYVGYICGGAFYFVENTNDDMEMKILHRE